MSSERGNRRWLSLLLIASLAFNIGVGATFGVMTYRKHAPSKEHPGHRGHGGGPLRSCWLDELSLTQEQQAQIEAIKEAMHTRSGDLRQALKEENRALAELMASPDPDHEAIAAQLGTIAASHQQMTQCVVDHFLNIKQLLGPDQQEAFNDKIRRVFSHHRPGRGGFGGRHGPYRGAGRGKCGSFSDGED